MENKLIMSANVLTIGETTFFFSTETAMTTFIEKRDDQLKETNARIMKIYKDLFNIDIEILSDIRLYHKINRRGFLVKHRGVLYNSLDEIRFTMKTIEQA